MIIFKPFSYFHVTQRACYLYSRLFRTAYHFIIRYPAPTVSCKVVETLILIHVVSIIAEAELVKVSLHVFTAYPTVRAVY